MNRPHMLTDASFHRRGNAQGLMNPCEVIVHVKQGNHGDVILNLLTEGVRQAGESAHVHPHIEVLPLHVAGADVFMVRGADNVYALGAQTLCRAVAFLPVRIVAVDFHQLRVVHVLRERIGHSHQVHLVAVRGQLDSIRQAALNILKKLRRTPGVPPSDHPGHYQFGLSFDCGERPNVTAGAGFQFGSGDVLLFASDKRPDFINLNTLCGNVADNTVLVVSTGRADANQETKDSAFRDSSHADGGANRAAFHQRRDDRDLLCRADYVCHNQSIRQRFRIVKRKAEKYRILSRFLYFCPPRLGGFSRASFALFIGHSLKAALTADLAALGPHLPHDLLNDGELDGLCGFNGFQENAPGVLDGIEGFCTASPLWHTSSVARMAGPRQGARISNRPTA